MARLSLAVGYLSRATARTEQPVLLYLGTSFEAAKAAIHAPPADIGYAEAYRLDAKATKSHHVPGFVPPAAPLPEPELDLLPDPPKPAAKKAAKEPAED